MAATITSPKRTNGCFETNKILYFIACAAFKFAKTIKGIVKKVRNEINIVVTVPTKLNPADSRSSANDVLSNPIKITDKKILKM